MNQHYGLDGMDYGELARDMKLIAIDEMRHAEHFAERIKALDGEPTTDLAAKVVKAQDVRAIFPSTPTRKTQHHRRCTTSFCRSAASAATT
jgi:bacterioferritin